MSRFVSWAIEEIKRAGLYDEDSPYSGELGKALEELVRVFDKQDHSGFSASMMVPLLERLLQYKPLTPITNDPSEWTETSEREGEKLFQCKRCSSLFATESQLQQNKAVDHNFYYKVNEDGVTYQDEECSKVVSLPYFPPTFPQLLVKEERK